MHYVFADDAMAYDGYAPGRRPLGGAEKAVIGLATALLRRGHRVTVLNRLSYPTVADGVRYQPLGDLQRPTDADVLIASRQPLLLGALRKVRHRLLWVMAAPEYLQSPANVTLWESFSPALLFISAAQQRGYSGALPHRLLTPGVGSTFFELPQPYQPYPEYEPPEVAATVAAGPPPPHAVVTTHPLHGLIWLIDLWVEAVHPHMPAARLAVYSTTLAKGLRGDAVPEPMAPVLERIKAAAKANVVVVEPRNDSGMAEIYRASRVHLYPGHGQDFACWTLVESQAAGVPAVARGVGGVEERVVNGQSGYIVPDANAFANVALEILRNDAVHASLAAAAADPLRRHTWDTAAAEVDDFVATLAATPENQPAAKGAP